MRQNTEWNALPEHQTNSRTASTEVNGRTPVKTPVKTPDRIVELLREHPHMTLAEVAAQIGKSLRAVERAAAKLTSEGRLRYVGPRKGGHWEVLE